MELSCDVPRRTTAVTWYHGSRILGTAKILPDQDGRGGSHHTSAPILLPWDLEYDSEPYVLTASFDPKGWLQINIQNINPTQWYPHVQKRKFLVFSSIFRKASYRHTFSEMLYYVERNFIIFLIPSYFYRLIFGFRDFMLCRNFNLIFQANAKFFDLTTKLCISCSVFITS